MLSDEEKKAIEYWKTHMEILHWNTQLASEHYIKVLLDLIEKNFKEIEELNKSDASKEQSSMKYYNLYKELVDKIKAKIEEIDKILNEDIYSIDGHYDDRYYRYLQDRHILQSLLRKEFPVTITKEELEKRWKE